MDAITQVPASPEVKAEQNRRARKQRRHRRMAVIVWTAAVVFGALCWTGLALAALYVGGAL